MKNRIWISFVSIFLLGSIFNLEQLHAQLLPELPEFPPISYEGITASSTNYSLPGFGSTGYSSSDYQALYENLTDWKGLSAGGTGLDLTVDLSQFDRPLHPGLLSASSNAAGQSLWLTGGTNPAWQGNVSATALARLKGIQEGRAPKAHSVFNTNGDLDEIFFYADELGVDREEFFITPFGAGKTSGSASAQAATLTQMLDYGRKTKGYDIRNLEIVSEPYHMTSSSHINYQKEGAIAIKNWFATNAPGVPFQVKASVSRATTDNNNEGSESTGLFLADVLRPFCTTIDLHPYVFGVITRGDYNHTTSNIRDWAVGESIGMANRVAHFAKLARNEYNRPLDDGITRWIQLGEWSAPKEEYVGDYARSGSKTSRDGCIVFRGMVGVMYKFLFLQELSKIPNVRNASTWADVAGTMTNGYATNYPKTGNGQMIWKNDDNVTFAHYWGFKTMQDYWGVACPEISGTTPYAAAGKASSYYFGSQGPNVIGPFPVMVPHISVNETQDRLYVIVANTDLTTSRDVNITLDGRNWSGSKPTVVSARIIKAIENNTRDTWKGGRMEFGKLDANGGEIGGPGKFIDDYSGNLSLNGNVLSWADQSPFSIVYVEVDITPPVSMLQNTGFEDSLTYWTSTGAPWVVAPDDPDNAAEGSRYLSCKWRSGDGDEAPGVSQVVELIQGGAKYAFTWQTWLNDLGVNAGLRVTWLDSLSNPINSAETGLSTGTNMSWTEKTDTLTAPDAAFKAEVYVGFMEKDDVGVNNEARFDSVVMVMVFPPDKDNDGISDNYDNCLLTANADQLDTDNDGTGDACDSDDDGDGIADEDDNCPLTANADQLDTDSDGIGDACDSDDDGDGIADADDNCPLTANADQLDTDSNGMGDACDSDDDGDGIADEDDNCPLTANADQQDADEDGIGDACDTDNDGDGIADNVDNCLLIANADQLDTDGDSIGDACDSDDDGDGITDDEDNCPLTANADQLDTDGDGIGDACEEVGMNAESAKSRSLNFYPNPANDQLNIEINDTYIDGTSSISILDMMGRVMYTSVVQEPKFSIEINELPGGMYLIRYGSELRNEIMKFNKE